VCIKKGIYVLTLVTVLFILGTFLTFAVEPEIITIPQVQVRFAIGAYADHSHSYLATSENWFEEVGIDIIPKPHGGMIKGEDMPFVIEAGTYDIVQNFTKALTAVFAETTNQKMVVLCDLSIGTALLGDPEKYKSFEEFLDEGYSKDEAYKITMEQVRGKQIPYDGCTAARGTIAYAFEKAGMDMEKDVDFQIMEDPAKLAMIKSGRADLIVPTGVPVVVDLTLQGWKTIISNGMIMKHFNPETDSRDVLLTILFAGIGSSNRYIEENYETILRFASVYYRLLDFMVYESEEAVRKHLPFINSIAGTNLTEEALMQIYKVLQPFRTFEQQAEWYLDKNSPYYWEYIFEEDIKYWEREGAYEKGKYTPYDACVSSQVYQDLLLFRLQSEDAIKEIEQTLVKNTDSTVDLSRVKQLLEQAKHHYNIRNYLDAKRFAISANEWAEYLLR